MGFSRNWLLASLGIMVAVELVLYNGAAGLIAGCFGHVTKYKVEVLVLLLGFYCGGFVVGFISPDVRVAEAAVAAVGSVLLAFLISFFTPMMFFTFNMGKLLIGGAIASFLGASGAKSGEKLAAAMGNRASKQYLGT